MNQQIKMLEKVSDKIDHTRLGLTKVDTRLGELISEMDFCKLWTVIVLECILLVIIMCM